MYTFANVLALNVFVYMHSPSLYIALYCCATAFAGLLPNYTLFLYSRELFVTTLFCISFFLFTQPKIMCIRPKTVNFFSTFVTFLYQIKSVYNYITQLNMYVCV